VEKYGAIGTHTTTHLQSTLKKDHDYITTR
jgi:hypothetical protein